MLSSVRDMGPEPDFDAYESPAQLAGDLNVSLLGALNRSGGGAERPIGLGDLLDERAPYEGVVDRIELLSGRIPLRLLGCFGLREDGARCRLAANLASRLAARGRQVTVVDASLDRGCLAGEPDAPREGLMDMLLYGCSYHAAAQATAVRGVRLVTLGSHPWSGEPIHTDDWERVLAALRQHSDLTLMVAATDLEATTLAVLSRRLDSIVLAYTLDDWSREAIRRSYLTLWDMDAPILGVVTEGRLMTAQGSPPAREETLAVAPPILGDDWAKKFFEPISLTSDQDGGTEVVVRESAELTDDRDDAERFWTHEVERILDLAGTELPALNQGTDASDAEVVAFDVRKADSAEEKAEVPAAEEPEADLATPADAGLLDEDDWLAMLGSDAAPPERTRPTWVPPLQTPSTPPGAEHVPPTVAGPEPAPPTPPGPEQEPQAPSAPQQTPPTPAEPVAGGVQDPEHSDALRNLGVGNPQPPAAEEPGRIEIVHDVDPASLDELSRREPTPAHGSEPPVDDQDASFDVEHALGLEQPGVEDASLAAADGDTGAGQRPREGRIDVVYDPNSDVNATGSRGEEPTSDRLPDEDANEVSGLSRFASVDSAAAETGSGGAGDSVRDAAGDDGLMIERDGTRFSPDAEAMESEPPAIGDEASESPPVQRILGWDAVADTREPAGIEAEPPASDETVEPPGTDVADELPPVEAPEPSINLDGPSDAGATAPGAEAAPGEVADALPGEAAPADLPPVEEVAGGTEPVAAAPADLPPDQASGALEPPRDAESALEARGSVDADLPAEERDPMDVESVLDEFARRDEGEREPEPAAKDTRETAPPPPVHKQGPRIVHPAQGGTAEAPEDTGAINELLEEILGEPVDQAREQRGAEAEDHAQLAGVAAGIDETEEGRGDDDERAPVVAGRTPWRIVVVGGFIGVVAVLLWAYQHDIIRFEARPPSPVVVDGELVFAEPPADEDGAKATDRAQRASITAGRMPPPTEASDRRAQGTETATSPDAASVPPLETAGPPAEPAGRSAAESPPAPPAKPGETAAQRNAATSRTPAERSGRIYAVHVASFRTTARAEQDLRRWTKAGYTGRIVKTQIRGKGTWYRIYVGEYANLAAARAGAKRLVASSMTDFAQARALDE